MSIDDLYVPPVAPKPPMYCSFCGKSQHEVRKLIAGPTVFVCDACVECCFDLVHPALSKFIPALNEFLDARIKERATK